MQATIYVTEQAYAVVNAIKDLSHHERMLLADDPCTDLSDKAGYYLKNANRMRFAVLPADALIGVVLTPHHPPIYQRHVAFETTLRGCLFENAPLLPAGFADNVTYWSGLPVNANTSGAVYYQNTNGNEYMVDITALDAAEGDPVAVAAAALTMDKLLSEGVVVSLRGVENLIGDLSIHHYIELHVPVVPSMLGIEPEGFRSEQQYATDPSPQYERVFLKVTDILCGPDRDRIYLDLLRQDLMIDYGYWY